MESNSPHETQPSECLIFQRPSIRWLNTWQVKCLIISCIIEFSWTELARKSTVGTLKAILIILDLGIGLDMELDDVIPVLEAAVTSPLYKDKVWTNLVET